MHRLFRRIVIVSFAAAVLTTTADAQDKVTIVQRLRAELATLLKKDAAKLPVDKPVATLGADELTVIEVNGLDRTGLLYDLASILTNLHVDISSAHIATFGEKAVDVFYVTDSTRKKITREATQKKLRESLLEAFERVSELVAEDS